MLREEIEEQRMSGSSQKQIAKYLDISPQLVFYYIKQPQRLAMFRERHNWTKREIRKLKYYYPYAIRADITENLPRRTWSSISNKAYIEKIKRLSYYRPKYKDYYN